MAIDPNDPRIQEFMREQEAEKAASAGKKAGKKGGKAEPLTQEQAAKKSTAAPELNIPEYPTGEHKQRRIIKRTRAGVKLSREEVKAIKIGRKKLRKELRQRGIRSKREFELTAGALGLYFDKHNGFLLWLRAHWLGALLGALLALLLVLLIFAVVTQVRGFFTINLSGGLFREGFTLSDSAGFENPTTQLYAIPAEGVPCISINQIAEDVNETDGEHNGSYFAYTYYIRNEGETTVDFMWSVNLNAESRRLSDAAWVMVFVDGVPTIYAKPSPERGAEALPDIGDDSRGFLSLPVLEYYGAEQREPVRSVGGVTYYRVLSEPFESDEVVASGVHTGVKPMDVHKYTIVLWLEGDDHDCNNDLIGGYLGMEMQFRLLGEEQGSGTTGRTVGGSIRSLWDNLRYWTSGETKTEVHFSASESRETEIEEIPQQ